MAVTAKKDEEITQSAQENSPGETEPATKKPWHRQEGESSLWFNRFLRYRKLGPKRSLQATVEQERAHIQALKSTKIEEKPRADAKKGQKQTSARVAVEQTPLHEVPRPKPQVPGSWKQASVQWRWKERALAHDEWAIDYIVEKHIDDILTDAAVGIERVDILKNLLAVVTKIYDANRQAMTYEQEIAFIARMQSILKDIREEMQVYDASLTRVLIKRVAISVYASATPEELKAGRFVEKRTP